MGYGSPTWAHATTHFRRPDDVEKPKAMPKAITSLGKVKAFETARANLVCLADNIEIPAESRTRSEYALESERAQNARESVEFSMKMDRIFAQLANPKARRKVIEYA